MKNYKLSTEYNEMIINALDNHGEFRYPGEGLNVYFGDENWCYLNNGVLTIHIQDIKSDVSFGIHLVPGTLVNDARINVIVNENEFFHDDFEDVKMAASKLYTTEEEYFQDSTVKDMRIPYELMVSVQKFIEDFRCDLIK
ncbi:hypothetical protein VWH97_05610 [Escherichia coli O157]|nr:hypothetical protein [Escherichia coli O157]USL83826.1 hypothetical protein A4_159 [Escherichia phage A4]